MLQEKCANTKSMDANSPISEGGFKHVSKNAMERGVYARLRRFNLEKRAFPNFSRLHEF